MNARWKAWTLNAARCCLDAHQSVILRGREGSPLEHSTITLHCFCCLAPGEVVLAGDSTVGQQHVEPDSTHVVWPELRGTAPLKCCRQPTACEMVACTAVHCFACGQSAFLRSPLSCFQLSAYTAIFHFYQWFPYSEPSFLISYLCRWWLLCH